MDLYGLIGFPIKQSGSQAIFREYFAKSQLKNADYILYPLTSIELFPSLISQNPEIKGLNVTIPYKKQVISYLNETDPQAKEIGAVNVVKVSRKKGKVWMKGYNTDLVGFEVSFTNFVGNIKGLKALILGSGGASMVVKYVFKKLNIPYLIVSRGRNYGDLDYPELNASVLKDHRIIVNTTPVGMYPNVNLCPEIPFEFIGNNHLLFDLIYNPAETLFLKKGRKQGAGIMNGHEMLHLQAAKAWEIWNS